MGQIIKEFKGKIIFKHETEADWNQSNYIPQNGEQVFYDPDEIHDYKRVKYGDGEHKVTELPFSGAAELAAITELQGRMDTAEGDIVTLQTQAPYSIGLTFEANGDGTCIVSGLGDCTDTNVVIPRKSPDGDLVTSIGSNAFLDCTGLTSITIPDSVTNIGDTAFLDCTGLTSIVIPDSVTSIGEYAFAGCTNLTIYTEAAEKPSGWSNTWNYNNYPVVWGAVLDFPSVNDELVKIDDAINNTDNGEIHTNTIAAKKYYNLVTADEASLSALTFTPNNDNIGTCTVSLNNRDVSSITIPTFSPDGDLVTAIDGMAFYYYESLTSIVIPDSVTSIGDSAFEGCEGLTSITIPASVESIGGSAFNVCTGLTSVTIPDNVTTISDYVFQNCTGLTSITIPDTVTSISDGAFSYCTDLTSIVIPASVESIGSSAFRNCTGLTIYAEATEKPDGWDDNWNPDNRPVVWGMKLDTPTIYSKLASKADIVKSDSGDISLKVGDTLISEVQLIKLINFLDTIEEV